MKYYSLRRESTPGKLEDERVTFYGSLCNVSLAPFNSHCTGEAFALGLSAGIVIGST